MTAASGGVTPGEAAGRPDERRWAPVPPPPSSRDGRRWLVICHPWDLPALWAYRGLTRRGLGPLELVSVEALLAATRWEHRLSANGAFFDVTLVDGRRFTSESVAGVLNRILVAAPPQLLSVVPSDRRYAEQEFLALVLSWLNAVRGPVLNPATPQGLSGRWRSEPEWRVVAAQAGLSVTPFRVSSAMPAHPGSSGVSGAAASWGAGGPIAVAAASAQAPLAASGAGVSGAAGPGTTGGTAVAGVGLVSTYVIVVGRRIVGDPVDEGVRQACRRLAELAETPLLGVALSPGREAAPVFAGATPLPDLLWGGEPLLDALAEALHLQPAAPG
ncbi:MAG: hypothetical protein HY704_10220 [Gemmatimonadetes bacterium]|nr:hypothetical protein [Gemmatimonadota bacterium]